MYDLDSDFRDNGSFFKALRNFYGSWELRFWATFYDSMGGSSLEHEVLYRCRKIETPQRILVRLVKIILSRHWQL